MNLCVKDKKKGAKIVDHKSVMKIEDGSCMVWTDEREIQKRKRGNESMCESTKLAAIALAQGMIVEMFVPCTSSSKWSPK